MNRSTAEAAIYEREAERARHQLTQSIHELRGKMTTSQVIEEVMGYMRSGGSNVVAGLATAMRENPVPTMLIATGCALFLRGSGNGRGPAARNGSGNGHGYGHDEDASGLRRSARGTGAGIAAAASGAADTVRGAASAAAEGVRGAAGSVRDTAYAAGEAVRETAAAAGEAVRGTTSSATDAVRDTARSTGETVRGYAAAAGDRVTDTWHDAERGSRELYDSAMRLAQEQPLMVAAIGVALGAAIGAALPTTRVENDLLGDTADKVRRAAGDAFHEVSDAVRREASGAVADVRQAVADNSGEGQPRYASEPASYAGGQRRS